MKKDKILSAINNCIDAILNEKTIKNMFHKMLHELLYATDNRMGFVGELKFTDAGSPYFRYKAVVFKSNISSFNEYHKKHFIKNDNLDLYNMNTLYGLVYKTKGTIISNDVYNDPRRDGVCKLPKDHPHLKKFMGIPLIHNDNLLGMIGISDPIDDREYNESELVNIEPFCKLFVFAFVYWKRRESLNNTRNNFLLHMSHEIKTPLNGIIGMTQSFLDTDLTAEQLDIIKTISKCNLRLLTIVNDIGDFYKISVGQIELDYKPILIKGVIEEAYETYIDEFKTKGLTFKYDISPEINRNLLIDRKRLYQILINLLSNSINNTIKGGIYIKVYKNIKQTQKLEGTKNEIIIGFEITDTGLGISKEKLDGLLHDFNNLEDYLIVNPNTGRGLGLSICNMLTKLMGGNIEINSIVNSGTVITFNIKTEISDNVDSLKLLIKSKIEGSYILVLTNDITDRLKLSNLIISLGIIPIIPNSDIEALIYINNSNIVFNIIIVSEQYIESEIIMEAKTKISDTYIIGISENTKFPFINSYISINFNDTDIIKQLYNYCNKKYNLDTVIDAQEYLVNDIINMNNNISINNDNTLTDKHIIQFEHIHILIAEDEIANQKVLSKSLHRLGYYNIEIVTNGQDMVEYAKNKQYDIIFIDIRMPIMDGLTATKHIIQYCDDNYLDYPYMIAVTALEDLDMKKKYSQTGIHFILKKPFHFSAVEKIMNIVIEHKNEINNKIE